jgi:hypothetical protein
VPGKVLSRLASGVEQAIGAVSLWNLALPRELGRRQQNSPIKRRVKMGGRLKVHDIRLGAAGLELIGKGWSFELGIRAIRFS